MYIKSSILWITGISNIDSYVAFLFEHLSVDDPFDEDTIMAPPFDWRYVEPTDPMQVGKYCLHGHKFSCYMTYLLICGLLDDDLLSVMSITLPSSPFYYYDDDPIMIGKCES